MRKQTRDTNHQDEGGNADQKQAEEKSKRHYGLEVRRLISTNCTEGPKEPKGQKGQRTKKRAKGLKGSPNSSTLIRFSKQTIDRERRNGGRDRDQNAKTVTEPNAPRNPGTIWRSKNQSRAANQNQERCPKALKAEEIRLSRRKR